MEVAASIIAILQISGKVTTYIQTASGAKSDRKRLRDEIRACEDILQELKDDADNSEAGKAWMEHIKVLDQPGGILHRLRKALSVVETRLQQDSMNKILKWPFHEKETMKLVDAIEREKNLLKLALANHDGRLLHEMNARSQENTEQLVELVRMLDLNTELSRETLINLGKLESSQAKLHSDFEALQKHGDVLENAQERNEILNWLSKANHSSSYHDAIHRRHDTTGTWFLDSSEYKIWLAAKGKTLFCPGMPGAGKTIMASVVIADLFERYKNELLYGVAFLFNVFNEKQSPKELLASLLQQLAKRQDHLPVSIKALYKRHGNGQMQTPLSMRDIIGGIRALVNPLQRTFLVIDALDECHTDFVRDFLSTIFRLRDECGINILATSRDIPDIISQFKGTDVLEIRAMDGDIEHFVRGRSHRLSNVVHNDPKLLEETAVKVAQSAQGMFLLAQLHVDSLAFKKSKKAFRDALKKLASGSTAYDTAYNSAMERINGQAEEQAQFAREVLSWITCTKRPLAILELCEALAVEDGVFELDPDNRPCLEDILSVCAGLVVVDEGSNKVRLVHYTTREYFDRTRKLWFPNAELIIAKICITYLSLSVFSLPRHDDAYDTGSSTRVSYDAEFQPRTLSRRDLRYSYALYGYAAGHWAAHVNSTDAAQIQGAIVNFLSQHGPVRHALEALEHIEACGATGLHLAARFELYDIVVTLLGLGFDVNAVVEYHGVNDYLRRKAGTIEHTALTIAAEHGFTSIVQLLISVDAKLDTKFTSKSSHSPIQKATINGHEDAVKLLVQGSTVKDLQSSLLSAIHTHSVSLCEVLLERTPVESDDEFMPLHDAVFEGRKAIVDLLLKKHYPKDLKDRHGRSPLFCAAMCGHTHIVRQLLRANVTVDSADRSNQTPLHMAIKRGYAGIVELLLLAGADIEVQDCNLDTAISLAAKSSTDVMSMLIPRATTDVLWRDEELKPLLLTAAHQGNKALVKRLLERGADLHCSDKDGLSPLMRAIDGNQLTMTAYLLQRGAKVSQQDAWGHTPLHIAIYRFRRDIIKLLVDSGAGVDIKDANGGSTLHAAAIKGMIVNLDYILSKGPNINLQDNAGRTALWLACKNNHVDVACKLLAFGADWRIPNHAGIDVKAITASRKDFEVFRTACTRRQNQDFILQLMKRRQTATAHHASEQ